MRCTRSPVSGGFRCCAFCTGPVNADVIRLTAQLKPMQSFKMKDVRNSLSKLVGERTLYVLFSTGCWSIILVLILVFVYFYSYLPEQRRHHDAFNLNSTLIGSIEFSPFSSGQSEPNIRSLIDKHLTVTDPASVLKITDALRSAERVARNDAGLNEIRTRCSMVINCGENRHRYTLSLSRNNCTVFFRQRFYRIEELRDFLVKLYLRDSVNRNSAG